MLNWLLDIILSTKSLQVTFKTEMLDQIGNVIPTQNIKNNKTIIGYRTQGNERKNNLEEDVWATSSNSNNFKH